MYREIAGFAEDVAAGAGRLLLAGFRNRNLSVSYKGVSDLVTNMDRASEEYIFGRIRERFPDHSVVAEEGARHDGAGDLVWYVDPLDGTTNYAHGIHLFSVSLGVFSKKMSRVCAGAVHIPATGEMFSASRDNGAFLNGKAIHVSETTELENSLLTTGFPYDKADPDNNNSLELGRMLPGTQDVRRTGSAALDLSYVSCGRFDGYWERGLKPWDTAAGSLIVEEAGGRVTGYGGGEYRPEFPEIVASNGHIHDAMIRILSK